MTGWSGKPTILLLKYVTGYSPERAGRVEWVRVAELADAQDLGSCGRKVLEVRSLSLTQNGKYRTVTPGIASDERRKIVSGLNENEQVVL